MVVKNWLSLPLIVALMSGCAFNSSTDNKSIEVARKAGCFEDGEQHSAPLAAIINPGIQQEDSVLFVLKENTDVKLHGSGELLYNLASVPVDYLFKGDDIEFYYKDSENIPQAIIFDWGQATGAGGRYRQELPCGAVMTAFSEVDSLKRRRFFAKLALPFLAARLPLPATGSKFSFEIAVGDTDDHFAQKGKLACFNTSDPLADLKRGYGIMTLTGPGQQKVTQPLTSTFGYYSLEKAKAELANKTNVISRTAFGFIKDDHDLSARFVSCWTRDSLFFFIQGTDDILDRLEREAFGREQTFADYGWLKDQKGKRIWTMNALHSVHAGGALKNHKADTVLHLKKGAYWLGYYSDESHAFKHWDDAPPESGYYGIWAFSNNKVH